jgi:hypothetical protein
MGQPTWREIKTLRVPEHRGVVWTPALDYVTPAKLYLIRVEPPSPAARTEPEPPYEPQDPAIRALAAAGASHEARLNALNAAGRAAHAKHPTHDHNPPNAGKPQGREPDKGNPAAAASPPEQHWQPEATPACTADGDPNVNRAEVITDTCAPGALIGKVGGSTADVKPDKEKVTVFGVGRHCVFSITDATKTGALYLGMNDARASLTHASGSLEIKIYESL